MEVPDRVRPDLASTAVANGVVYVASGVGTGYSDLYALDAGTGALIWQDHCHRRSPCAAVANGVVYIGGIGPYVCP